MFPECPEQERLTRQRLMAGTLLEALRANPPPGVVLRTDEELAESLEATLREHDPAQDLHVFGYGSLMWNPALDASQASVAQLRGWHRRFCLRMVLGRGSAQEPGVMLALDRGGACNGMLFRIEASKVRAEARLLWRREMLAGSYDARWVTARVSGKPIRTLVFVANRECPRYIDSRSLDEVAQLVRTGKGQLGSSREYFDATLRALSKLGIRDRGMQRLAQAIRLADERSA